MCRGFGVLLLGGGVHLCRVRDLMCFCWGGGGVHLCRGFGVLLLGGGVHLCRVRDLMCFCLGRGGSFV